MADRAFYTLAEAAHALGVHYETAARWVRTGKLPGVKLSRRKVVVPREQLDALVSGKQPPSSEEPQLPVGHPRRWLALAGMLTPEEAAFIRETLKDLERIEEAT